MRGMFHHFSLNFMQKAKFWPRKKIVWCSLIYTIGWTHLCKILQSSTWLDWGDDVSSSYWQQQQHQQLRQSSSAWLVVAEEMCKLLTRHHWVIRRANNWSRRATRIERLSCWGRSTRPWWRKVGCGSLRAERLSWQVVDRLVQPRVREVGLQLP